MAPKAELLSRYSTLESVDAHSVEDVDPAKLTPITTLGRGSYGKVVLARVDNQLDESEDDLVAVKIVAKSRLRSRGQVEKSRTELKVMRNVAPSCPFLIATRGAFQTDDCLFYIMPYTPGGELFFHLQRDGRFSEPRTRLISMQIVLGLEHLHSHGVLYRDLKPENILISMEGRCQLADFGLSKFLPRLTQSKSNSIDSAPVGKPEKRQSIISKLLGVNKRKQSTEKAPRSNEVIWGTTRTRCGTPAYQSFEIVQAKEHSLEADWWALGVLIYELLVGEPPFFASTVKEVYDLILANSPRYPKKVSEKAKSLISKLLVSERTERLGYGAQGASDVKNASFFMSPAAEAKTSDYPTWDQVSRLAIQPVLNLSESGVVGRPKDAVFFHADYTSIDVREYVTPPKAPLDVEGFQTVAQSHFSMFLSDSPIPVVEKAAHSPPIENDGLTKEVK